jgi:hypothetical protein
MMHAAGMNQLHGTQIENSTASWVASKPISNLGVEVFATAGYWFGPWIAAFASFVPFRMQPLKQATLAVLAGRCLESSLVLPALSLGEAPGTCTLQGHRGFLLQGNCKGSVTTSRCAD